MWVWALWRAVEAGLVGVSHRLVWERGKGTCLGQQREGGGCVGGEREREGGCVLGEGGKICAGRGRKDLCSEREYLCW